MDQAEMQTTLTLFDLLAREWTTSASVSAVKFNRNQTAVVFMSADGSLAIAELEDSESPNSRLRTDIENGQTSIRPRSAEISALIKVPSLAKGAAPIAACGSSGFAVGGADGDAHFIAQDGTASPLCPRFDAPVSAVDAHAETTRTAIAAGDQIAIVSGDECAEEWRFETEHLLTSIALAPNGIDLATGHRGGLTIWSLTETPQDRKRVTFSGTPTEITWSHDGAWIACALTKGGFQLIRLSDWATTVISDYPTPVRTTTWSRPANALATSGAFRPTAWSMNAPPLGGETSGALQTGRAGMVVVDTVAAHPTRDLLAVGYADGLMNIVRIGHREELMVRPDGRGAVTALAWSEDGDHLAIGSADGSVAIVTFPTHMFK